jgi:hypothetical protein
LRGGLCEKKEAEIPFEISALTHSLLQSQWETLFGVSWNFGFTAPLWEPYFVAM